MTDFENKLRLKTISTQLMSIAVAKNNLIEQVQEVASREVDGTPSCERFPWSATIIIHPDCSPSNIVPRKYDFDESYGVVYDMVWEGISRSQYWQRSAKTVCRKSRYRG
jgi:hypothetical protein